MRQSLPDSPTFWSTALWYLGGASVLQLLNFLAQPVFALLMTPAEWGIASTYVFWMTAFGLLIGGQAQSALNNVRTTFGTKELGRYIVTMLPLYAVPFIALLLAWSVAPQFWSEALSLPASYLLLAIINGLLFAISIMAMSHAVSLGHRRRYLALTFAGTLGPIALGLPLVLILPDAALGRILAYLFGTAVLVAVIVFQAPRRRLQRNRSYMPFGLAIALPLLAHELFFLVMNQSNRVFLLNMDGATAAGVFAFAFSVGNVATVAATAVNSGWTPWYFTHTASGDDDEVRRTSARLVMIFATLSSAAALVSPEVLRLVTAEPYWAGARIVPMFIVAGHVLLVFNMAANYLVFRRRTKLILLISGVGCALNVVLNLLLISRFSIVGAAWASLAAACWLAAATLVVDLLVVGCRNLPYRVIVASLIVSGTTLAVCLTQAHQPVVRYAVAALLLLASLGAVRRSSRRALTEFN